MPFLQNTSGRLLLVVYLFSLSINSKTFWEVLATFILVRSSRPEVLCDRDVLKNFVKFIGKHLYQSLFVNKETLSQVLSCQYHEISKNTFFNITLLVAASDFSKKFSIKRIFICILKFNFICNMPTIISITRCDKTKMFSLYIFSTMWKQVSWKSTFEVIHMQCTNSD